MNTLRVSSALFALIAGTVVACGEQPKSKVDKLLAPGIAAMENLEYDKALRHFSESAKQAPFDPKLLFAIGQTHAALGQDALAAIYLAAHLTSWDNAPGRKRSGAELALYRARTKATGQTMLALAADLALALPEENRVAYRPGALTDKQRVVAHVITDLVKAYEFDAAERLATAHPVGATMALGRGAAEAMACDGWWEDYAARAFALAERIAKLEARSPDLHILWSHDVARDAYCTSLTTACPEGPSWIEPPIGQRAVAAEGILQIGLATWALSVRQQGLAIRLESSGQKKAITAFYTNVTLPGTLDGYDHWVPGLPRSVDLWASRGADRFTPTNPAVFESRALRGFAVTDPRRAIVERALPTGEPGEFVSFDDPLLVDTEGLVEKLSGLPATEAVVALSSAGRKLVRISAKIQ